MAMPDSYTPRFPPLRHSQAEPLFTRDTDDDDVGHRVLGCRADILGPNCKKLRLKSKDEWGGGGGGRVALASVCVIMSGGQ